MVSVFVMGVEYVEGQCCVQGCGISFAMTRAFYNRVRNSHELWYCPQGHSQHYTGKSDEQKLRDAEAREVALQDQLSAAIRDADATRAALLRDRARFAAGVCPCCNRSFENVRRHMVTKHPDYDVTKVHQPSAVKFRCSCGGSFDTLRGLRIHQGHARSTSGNWRWDKPGQSAWAAHLTKT